jgi:hypothetical protein
MERTLSTIAAGLALCSLVPAQAATTSQCLNPQEMQGLVAYFLPDVLSQVTKNCAAYLPADSYLRTGLPRLASQLTANKPATWPVAKAAFFKLSDPKDIKDMGSLPDKALQPLVDAVIASKMSIPVTPSICGEVNDISEALAPLTGDQTVHLLATIFSAAARKDNQLRSCPRESN